MATEVIFHRANGSSLYRPDSEITKHDEAAILSVEDTCSHLELKNS